MSWMILFTNEKQTNNFYLHIRFIFNLGNDIKQPLAKARKARKSQVPDVKYMYNFIAHVIASKTYLVKCLMNLREVNWIIFNYFHF